MINRAQLEQELANLRRQAAHYEQQLLMTQGAIQYAEHLLNSVAPDSKEADDALSGTE